MGWVGVLWVLELGLGCNIVLMSNENLNQENLCGYVNQYIFLGRAKEEAIQELRIKYNKDPALLADVINDLPVKEFDMKEFLGYGVAKGSIDILSEVVSTDEGITSSDAATTSDDDAMAGVNTVVFEGGAQTWEG